MVCFLPTTPACAHPPSIQVVVLWCRLQLLPSPAASLGEGILTRAARGTAGGSDLHLQDVLSVSTIWDFPLGGKSKKDQLPLAFQKIATLARNSKCHFWTFSTRPLARPNKYIFFYFILFSKMLQLIAKCESVVLLNMIYFDKPALFCVFNQHLLIHIFFFSFLLLLSVKQIKCKFVEHSPGQIFQGT